MAILFRHLVGTTQSDDTMGTARWQLSVRSAALAEFTPGSQVREIVDALVAARLLTTSEEGGIPTVRLAHQRVLQAWGRARAAVAANTDYYRVVSEIRQQCRRWQDSNGKPSLFLPKDILSQVRGHAQRFGNFDPLLTDFIAASRWRQHIFRFGIWIAAAPILILLVLSTDLITTMTVTGLWIRENVTLALFGTLVVMYSLSPLVLAAILLRYRSHQKSLIRKLIMQASSDESHNAIFLTAVQLRLRILLLNAIALLLIGMAIGLQDGITAYLESGRIIPEELSQNLSYGIQFVIASVILVWILGILLRFTVYARWEKAKLSAIASQRQNNSN